MVRIERTVAFVQFIGDNLYSLLWNQQVQIKVMGVNWLLNSHSVVRRVWV